MLVVQLNRDERGHLYSSALYLGKMHCRICATLHIDSVLALQTMRILLSSMCFHVHGALLLELLPSCLDGCSGGVVAVVEHWLWLLRHPLLDGTYGELRGTLLCYHAWT